MVAVSVTAGDGDHSPPAHGWLRVIGVTPSSGLHHRISLFEQTGLETGIGDRTTRNQRGEGLDNHESNVPRSRRCRLKHMY